MLVVAGPFLIVTSLVALAGAAKVLSPHPAARALASMKLPSHPMLVRALGAAELVLAAAAISAGGQVLPLLVGLLYTGFAGFVALILYRSRTLGTDVLSCGCFGVKDTPPGPLHVVVNIICAGIAFSAAAVAMPTAGRLLGDQPALGIPFVGYIILGTYLTYLVLAVLPELLHPQPSSPVATSFQLTSRAETKATS